MKASRSDFSENEEESILNLLDKYITLKLFFHIKNEKKLYHISKSIGTLKILVTRKEFVVFTKENSYKVYHDDSLYELDPDTGTLTIIKKSHLNKHSNFVKKRAPYLISKFGKRILEIIAGIGSITFFLTFGFGIPFILPMIIFENSPFLKWYLLLSLFLTALFIGLGFYCGSVVEYHRNSKCKACGKDYACEEFKEPQEIEISTNYYSSIAEIHYWKCKFCGYEDIRENSRTFCNKGKFSKLPELCQNCGSKNTIEEYRHPDIKTKNYDDVTLRYYRCKHCGYNAIEIEIEEGYID